MATTDQLRKAERRASRGLALNAYRSPDYRKALQNAGVDIPARATKVWLFNEVIARGIDMRPYRWRMEMSKLKQQDMPARVGDYVIARQPDGWIVRHAWLGEVLSSHSTKLDGIYAAKRYAAGDARRKAQRKED